jgi:putative spermidine/putrescine transport system permease protein
MRISRPWALLLVAPPLAFFAAFFVVPFGVVAIASLRTPEGLWTLEHYIRFFSDFYYWETLFLTFRVSLWVTLVTFLIGYPLAYFLTYVVRSRTVRRLGYIIIVTPLFTSNIVRAFGWMVLLGRTGLVNESLLAIGLIERPIRFLYSELAIVIGLSYIMTPFMVLTVASVLQNIDRSLEDAAVDLGANRLVTFLKVTFPLSLPGVIAGSLIVFTLSVSAYVTPAILSGGRLNVMSMLIFQQYASVFNFHFGAALAVTLLVATLILVALYLFTVERRPAAREA